MLNRIKTAWQKHTIQKEVDSLKKHFQPQWDAAKTEDEIESVDAAFLSEAREHLDRLDALEWSSLARTAGRLGVDVPGALLTRHAKLGREISDARLKWWKTIILELLVPVLGLVVAILGIWFAFIQLPEDVAALRLEVNPRDVYLLNRAPNEWLVGAPFLLRNDGDSAADEISIELQHHPSGWTGILQFENTAHLAPGDSRSLLFQLDTVADPHAALAAEAHFYFAIRAQWTNASTGKRACRVFYIDYRQAPGPEAGSRIPMVDVRQQRPEGLEAPQIAYCQESGSPN